MDSRELGLVLAQQLTNVQDLHYGFWDEETKPSVLAFFDAQQRYSEMIISTIREVLEDVSSKRIIDVGCGTGVILAQMLQAGYMVDGVIPADYLKKQVEERMRDLDAAYSPRIYECLFEEFPESERNGQYDLILFSESFQYIPMRENFQVMKSLLKPGGRVLISDFFRTVHDGDGAPGDKSFGGGHKILEFYELVETSGFRIIGDLDITKNLSPNLELVDEILMQRAYPAVQTIDSYLIEQYPLILKLAKWHFRKKLKKLKYKYFSGHRSKQTFERYKTYRLVILEIGS
jgi:SAM-dependent methyltransferase